MTANSKFGMKSDLQRQGAEVSMLRRILTLLAPAVLAVFCGAPALAQPHPPSFEIRIASTAPPPVRYERHSPRPDRDAVWTSGYWHWEGSRWGWNQGRWDRPAHPSHRWVAAHYAREGNVWRYEPPHWSNQHVVESDEYRRWKHEHHHS
jgi:hypothetical protein